MPRSTDLLVADTGPLIALSRVISLSTLPAIFGHVVEEALKLVGE